MIAKRILNTLGNVLRPALPPGWVDRAPTVARRVGQAATADVSASVSFRSGEDHGLLVLAADVGSAAALVAHLSGQSVQPGSPLLADGLAELANILAGAAQLNVGLPCAEYSPGHCIAALDGRELEHGAVLGPNGARLEVYVVGP